MYGLITWPTSSPQSFLLESFTIKYIELLWICHKTYYKDDTFTQVNQTEILSVILKSQTNILHGQSKKPKISNKIITHLMRKQFSMNSGTTKHLSDVFFTHKEIRKF